MEARMTHEVQKSRLYPADFTEFTDWYALRFRRKKGYLPSPNTLRSKRQGLATASRLAQAEGVDNLAILLTDRISVEDLLDHLTAELSGGTVRGIVWALVDFAEWAKYKGYVEGTLLQKSDAPGSNRQQPIVVYSAEEVELLLAASKGRGFRWCAFLTTIADTGRRVSEVLGFRYDQLRLDGERAYFELPVSKNGKPQYVPLGKRLREEIFTPENLSELKTGRDARFHYARSVEEFPFPWSYTAVHARFGRFCDEVKVTNRGFHNFRHTKATALIASGVPIQAVAGLLGHSDVSTTMRIYDHATALDYAEYNE